MKNKVILIDDSVTIHRVIDLSIDMDKYDIIKVFTQEAALPQLKEASFSFVLLDNKLENTNIAEYTSFIKTLQPSTKIILLVGAFDKFNPEDLLSIEADDYLIKPFDSQALHTKLSPDVSSGMAHQGIQQPVPATIAKNNQPDIHNDNNQISEKINKLNINTGTDFIQNMAQADMERETSNTGATPKPINIAELFHDPSETPHGMVAKGNTLSFEQRNSPFGDETQEPSQNNNEYFDPESQFAELSPADIDNDIQQNESLPEMDFGIPATDTLQEKNNINSSTDVGFAKEKTFAYSDESTPSTVKDNEFGVGRENELSTGEEPVYFDITHVTDKIEETHTINEQMGQTVNNLTPPHPVQNEQSLQQDAVEVPVQQSQIENQNANTETIEKNNLGEKELDMKEMDDGDFYQLDEDDIFNPKPVAKISEEEILSIDSPEKNEQHAPATPSLQEEPPTRIPESKVAETANQSNVTADETFFDPSILDHVMEDPAPNKTVAQKFEEEVLSVEAPDESDNPMDEVQRQKNLQTTFEEEILSLSSPEENQILHQHNEELNVTADNNIVTQPMNIPTSNVTQKMDADLASSQEFFNESDLSHTTEQNFNINNNNQDIDFMQSSSLETAPHNAGVHSDTVMGAQDNLDIDFLLNKDFADEIFPQDNEQPIDGNAAHNEPDLLTDKSFTDEFFSTEEAPAQHHEAIQNDPDMDFLRNAEAQTEDDMFLGKSDLSEQFAATFEDASEPSDIVAPQLADTSAYNMFAGNNINTSDPLLEENLDLDKLLEMDLTETDNIFSTSPQPNQEIQNKKQQQFSPTKDDNAFFEDGFNFEENTTSNDKSNENETLFTQSDDAFGDAMATSAPVKNKQNDYEDFDIIQADHTPSAGTVSPVASGDDNILSGITVTISKEEIIKMLGGAIDKHFLEKAVQDVLAQNMREIVRSIVPAIAEKFIKEEIEKLKIDE